MMNCKLSYFDFLPLFYFETNIRMKKKIKHTHARLHPRDHFTSFVFPVSNLAVVSEFFLFFSFLFQFFLPLSFLPSPE